MPPPWTSALCELYGPRGPEGGWNITRDTPFQSEDVARLANQVWSDARYRHAVIRVGEDGHVLVIGVFHGGVLPRGKFKKGHDLPMAARHRLKNFVNTCRARLR